MPYFKYDELASKWEKYAKARVDKAADRARRRAKIAAEAVKVKAKQALLEDQNYQKDRPKDDR